jgi:hypothetical protein
MNVKLFFLQGVIKNCGNSTVNLVEKISLLPSSLFSCRADFQ